MGENNLYAGIDSPAVKSINSHIVTASGIIKHKPPRAAVVELYKKGFCVDFIVRKFNESGLEMNEKMVKRFISGSKGEVYLRDSDKAVELPSKPQIKESLRLIAANEPLKFTVLSERLDEVYLFKCPVKRCKRLLVPRSVHIRKSDKINKELFFEVNKFNTRLLVSGSSLHKFERVIFTDRNRKYVEYKYVDTTVRVIGEKKYFVVKYT